MGLLFTLSLLLLSHTSFSSPNPNSQSNPIKSARLLDLYIRDFTFKSYPIHLIKTGALQNIYLPSNFSGIKVNTVRFRCGSLKRYGAKVNQFLLNNGVTIQPCVERLMIVTQNLGYNWSKIYYSNYDLSGYQLISPILGLLAYNAEIDLSSQNPFELEILAGEKPISVDFRNYSSGNNIKPYCASFEADGKVTLSKLTGMDCVCFARKNGHFGLVIGKPEPVELRGGERKWKMAVGSLIGGSVGVFLLGLILVAILVKVKKKMMKIEEMERRGNEDEALRVSMVGDFRAPMALGTRTLPVIEHDFLPPPR